MSNAGDNAVFLSYASQDAEAARRIAQALRAAGIRAWFDGSELRGGDVWDAKIRSQIDACSLFIPIISRHTQSRNKGYFRLEWKLAVDQSHLLADGIPFIAPVVIDDTPQRGALVPPEFLRVQWTRLAATDSPAPFVARVQQLLANEVPAASSVSSASNPAAPSPRRPSLRSRSRSRAGRASWPESSRSSRWRPAAVFGSR
jgi:hypothetical protein